MRTTYVIAALFAALFIHTASALAQRDAEACPRGVPTRVLLSRTCVSERGWRVDTDDCAAIYEVVAEWARARGATIRAAVCALSPNLHGEEEITRPWLRELEESGERPAHLGRIPWTRARCSGRLVGDECSGTVLPSRRDAWLWTLREVDALLSGEVGSVCAEPPRAWGSDADLRWRRLRGFRWEEVSCGTTVNHFGRVYALRRE